MCTQTMKIQVDTHTHHLPSILGFFSEMGDTVAGRHELNELIIHKNEIHTDIMWDFTDLLFWKDLAVAIAERKQKKKKQKNFRTVFIQK